ncbi:MAG: OmpH family outer membrane protein [Candidatus Paraprevotella stercoravium]|jgi:outer membrane protein|uniref:OmpH family outer membrane protein n=2 Tax=Bacteroidales TaxID=171549 RepID=A0ABT7U1S4_9BACE|nr:OmpH family outer membrane protein [Candidatus Paraprevotella stercoravium]MDM8144454.1 OmpH family outer membrane protein [Bacteroides eggerthii]
MKKKQFIYVGVLGGIMALSLNSCNQQKQQETEKETAEAATESAQKIGYVEIDTLMSQYNFCKDYTLLMNKKGENIRNTLASKERALHNQAADLQKKYESNAFTTRDQLESAQMALAKKQQDLQALNDQLMTEFANEQAKYNNQLRDSLQAFLKEYNKTKKFDIIISKAGDNLLYANPKYDITNDVVKGLNKRYKTSPELEKKLSGK